MTSARKLLSEQQRMDSAELAEMWRRIENMCFTTIDVTRLWWEIDALRFELAAADERTRIAREERKNIEGRYWRLQMKAVTGGPV